MRKALHNIHIQTQQCNKNKNQKQNKNTNKSKRKRQNNWFNLFISKTLVANNCYKNNKK